LEAEQIGEQKAETELEGISGGHEHFSGQCNNEALANGYAIHADHAGG
jgi:hypothetical protein